MYANITERLRAREVRKGAPGYIKKAGFEPILPEKTLVLTTALYFLPSPPPTPHLLFLCPLHPTLHLFVISGSSIHQPPFSG